MPFRILQPSDHAAQDLCSLSAFLPTSGISSATKTFAKHVSLGLNSTRHAMVGLVEAKASRGRCQGPSRTRLRGAQGKRSADAGVLGSWGPARSGLSPGALRVAGPRRLLAAASETATWARIERPRCQLPL